MEGFLNWFENLHGLARIVAIMIIAGLGHFLVQGIRWWGERILAPAHEPELTNKMAFTRRYPKLATLTPADWSYLRLKFRLWPGQELLIQETFKQRVVTALKDIDPTFAAWMVDITFGVEEAASGRRRALYAAAPVQGEYT